MMKKSENFWSVIAGNKQYRHDLIFYPALFSALLVFWLYSLYFKTGQIEQFLCLTLTDQLGTPLAIDVVAIALYPLIIVSAFYYREKAIANFLFDQPFPTGRRFLRFDKSFSVVLVAMIILIVTNAFNDELIKTADFSEPNSKLLALVFATITIFLLFIGYSTYLGVSTLNLVAYSSLAGFLFYLSNLIVEPCNYSIAFSLLLVSILGIVSWLVSAILTTIIVIIEIIVKAVYRLVVKVFRLCKKACQRLLRQTEADREFNLSYTAHYPGMMSGHKNKEAGKNKRKKEQRKADKEAELRGVGRPLRPATEAKAQSIEPEEPIAKKAISTQDPKPKKRPKGFRKKNLSKKKRIELRLRGEKKA